MIALDTLPGKEKSQRGVNCLNKQQHVDHYGGNKKQINAVKYNLKREKISLLLIFATHHCLLIALLFG